jgi:hypothetical protein
MKLKRSPVALAIFTLSLVLGLSLCPTSAWALAPSALDARIETLARDPVVAALAALAALTLVSTIILTCLLIHVRRTSCKNTGCSYHFRSTRATGSFDFSCIETPEELLTNTPAHFDPRSIPAEVSTQARDKSARGGTHFRTEPEPAKPLLRRVS